MVTGIFSMKKSNLNIFQILPSTRAYISEARQSPNFRLIDFIHAYLYSRWPYQYMSIGAGEHPIVRSCSAVISLLLRILCRFPIDKPLIGKSGLKPGRINYTKKSDQRTFADTYHGKVLRPDAARKLVSVKQEIKLTNLESVIPYTVARDLILTNPRHMVVLECPCRSARPNPCYPLDVCLIVAEPFISFVNEHYPDRARKINSDEAIDILHSEAERGHVHHAFFKEALFGRFFAICNCCACCCGAMQAQRNGIPMLASSGYVCVVDKDKCSACGTCVDKCPFGANRLADQYVQIDKRACMGCGVCTAFCPENALSLVRDYSRCDPLELDQLLEEPCR
jgi:Pyruvate/2-oxoacid:ferredoxin oxidoreductase delta subunit